MGQAELNVVAHGFREAVAMAGAAAVAHHGGGAFRECSQADAHPGDVGDAPAWLLFAANRPLAFSNAAQLNRFPLPAVKAKDTVGLLDSQLAPYWR